MSVLHTDQQCDDLPVVVNGNISYSLPSAPQHPHGTVANYTCDIGYTLNGISNPLCDDGVWTSNATCESVPLGKLSYNGSYNYMPLLLL